MVVMARRICALKKRERNAFLSSSAGADHPTKRSSHFVKADARNWPETETDRQTERRTR